MHLDSHPIFDELARALPDTATVDVPASATRRGSAVAALLRAVPEHPEDVEVLVIRRAERAGDLWSGHIALPGGRVDPVDADLVATARRETHEEVGIDLDAIDARFLGALPVLVPSIQRAPDIAVHPFVWAVGADVQQLVLLEAEVASARWIRFEQLRASHNVVEHHVAAPDGRAFTLPGVALDEGILWGITLRILESLYEVLDEVTG